MADGRGLSRKVDGEPDPEPPAAPPVIILSENSSEGGSQPQERDPGVAPHPASFSRSHSSTPELFSSEISTCTSANPKPRPEPEPHPAPPVIILARHSNRRAASSSPPALSPLTPHPRPPIHNGTIDKICHTTTLDFTHISRTMGSKASKLSPKNGKLQSSQEKKDKEEMKEPTNYYTHRSKSMRRKAGKEASSDGAGGVSLGSGGTGGAI